MTKTWESGILFIKIWNFCSILPFRDTCLWNRRAFPYGNDLWEGRRKAEVFAVKFFFSLFLLWRDSQERVFRALLILQVSLVLSEKS